MLDHQPKLFLKKGPTVLRKNAYICECSGGEKKSSFIDKIEPENLQHVNYLDGIYISKTRNIFSHLKLEAYIQNNKYSHPEFNAQRILSSCLYTQI